MSDTIKITFVGQDNNGFPQDNYEFVFSFSLFATQKVLDLWNAINLNSSLLADPANQNIIKDWFKKYFLGQIENFKFALNIFKGHSILHFLDSNIINLPSLTINNNVVGIDTGKTVGQYLIDYANKEQIPYRLYSYSCPSFSKVDPYYGTVVRFIALRFSYIKSILFRDAHSTTPNANQIDYDWLRHWYYSTNKKFMMYTAPWYNPSHASGDHVPFAATWAAKNINFPNDGCLTESEWNSSFGLLKQYDNTNFISKSNYGVDERLFGSIFLKPPFLEKDFYFVGITWLFYIFYNPPHTDSFYRYDPADEAKNNIMFFGKEVYLRKETKHYSSILSYFGTIKCQAYDVLQDCALFLNKLVNQVTIDEFFNAIEKLQRNNPNGTYARLPSKYHIWEYLFKTDGFDQNKSLLNYVENMAKGLLENHPSENLEKICDNSMFTFIGDSFQPDKNIYENTNLQIINLPNGHPLKNRY